MTTIIRYFSQITPESEDGSEKPIGKIEVFFHHHILVVLGEPGLGKTTSFEYAAKHERNAIFVRIGEFLSAPIDHLKGQILYLDGLDEHRSRVNSLDVMDALIGRLKELDSPKVRLSCRTADWHGGKDVKALMAVSPDAVVAELILEPLAEEDLPLLLDDSGDFVEGARQHGLDAFLKNPQTFFLLHDYYKNYQEGGGWPANKTELMEGSCKVLLQEPNENHAEIIDDWVTDKELAQTSAYICAVCLLSNIQGVSFNRRHADKFFPAIQEFDTDLFSMKAVISRRIFKPAGSNRVEPKHRMIAEYMAARFLANRIRAGLSIRRVLALLIGMDGRIPADLRGVYAWLVSMLSGMADRILEHDPYGAIIYGDAYAWRPSTKIRAIDALIKLTKKDRWFRHHDWSGKPLGGLSSPELVSNFKKILHTADEKFHLLSVILDAIEYGPKLPEMQEDLLAFIRTSERENFLKARAIGAFFNACPEQINDLEQILFDVHSDKIADPEQELRGVLLCKLYPDIIGYERIAEYLVTPPSFVFNDYFSFLKNVLLQKADPAGLKILFGSFSSKNKKFERDDEYDDHSVIGGLIRRLVEQFGESADAEELLSWLSFGLDQYNTSCIRREDAKILRRFMEEHPEVYMNLFKHFFAVRLDKERDVWNLLDHFKKVVLEVSPPYEFSRMLLEQLKQETQPKKNHGLFELMCILVFSHDELNSTSVSFEDLINIRGDDPELKKIYSEWSQYNIPEWHWDSFERAERHREEKKIRLARNIEALEKNKAAVEAGTATDILIHFAKIWFALSSDLDHDAEPADRLRQETGDMAESLLKSFIASLQHTKNFQILEEIAKADIKNGYYHSGYLMLAGMDILAEKGKELLLRLPDNILSLGLAYELTNHASRQHKWKPWLLEKRPDLVESVLDRCWRVQLDAKADSLTGFYQFPADYPFLPVISKILPGLLQDFPKASPRLLENMLLNAIHHCQEKLLPLVQAALLENRFPTDSGQRAMWTAAGFLLDTDQYFQPLQKLMGNKEENKWAVYLMLKDVLLERAQDGRPCQPISLRKKSIVLLGRHFVNKASHVHNNFPLTGLRHESFAAQDIRELLRFFEQDISDDSVKALEELENTPAISQYHSAIKVARANQFRTVAEAKFTQQF